MSPAFSMQSLYRNSLTVDTNHAQKFFEDEDNSVLDDNILDHGALDSGLELSPPMADSRRESFAVGSALFSPKTEDWQSVDMQSVPSNNPFMDPSTTNNPFFRLGHAQAAAFGPNGHGWPMVHSGSETPLHPFDGMTADFDAGASIFQGPLTGPTPFGNSGNLFASLGAPSEHSIPTSPQKEWVAAAQSMAKKMRPGSPGIRSHNELRRGDGIRKKNARFEIPAERNLSNIDQLIAQSTDEQEIKELKQQKRLLRNRQAALDSRQRKKQHTERLEDEKKQYTVIITDMEDEITQLKNKMEQLLHENQKYIHCIEDLTMEKDEMIRTHTIETGELRKKVSVLTDHVQRLEVSNGPNNSVGPNSFSAAYDQMDDMAMDGAWDAPNFLNDFPIESEVKQDMSLVPAKKVEHTISVDGEKSSSQGGLLFMLFLVGAFVLSNRSPPSLPAVSDDVRVASAALLDNVLKDAGVNPSASGVHAMMPQPSGTSWASAMPSMPVMPIDSVAPSMLSELGDSLTQPTDQQTNEQIFSLSAAQYNGVSDSAFIQNAHPTEKSSSQGRKNLADALAAMRATNKQTGAAEVYTRSLLWDQIPSEVVRNFAKMVAECNNAQNEQQCNEARS